MKPTLETGLIQVYTGNSKGKTTASFGLAMRAIGHGFKVFIIQFMKGNDYYGELKTLERLYPDIQLRQFGRNCINPEAKGQGRCRSCGHCFIHKGEGTDRDRAIANEALLFSKEIVNSGDYDVVILDELNNALRFGLLEIKPVLDFLKEKPEKVEIVITGRGAPAEMIEVADLVTEMTQVKHPIQKGIRARKGIEY